jgi:hypothetical protein
MNGARPTAFLAALSLTVALATATHASAGPLDAFTEAQLASALRGGGLDGAFAQGAALGQPDGFLKNPKVRIPLPPALKRMEGVLKTFGMEKELKALEVAMNRAAEAAVPEAKVVVIDAIKGMSLKDAKAILTGPDDAATQYFMRSTTAPLTAKLRPLVEKATAQVAVAKAYDKLVARGARYGVIDAERADLDAWVTRKALDGLFTTLAEHERAIRKDPLKLGSALLRDVFGAI